MVGGPCPTADAVCDAHGVVANKVGILTDLNRKGGVWVRSWRNSGVVAVFWDPVRSDVELVVQSLSFGGSWWIIDSRRKGSGDWRRHRVKVGRERGRREKRWMDWLRQSQLGMFGSIIR